MKVQTKKRWMMFGVMAVFLLPLLAAFVLSESSWQPQKTINSGSLVQPPRDVTQTLVTLADGSQFDWHDPQLRWTLLALPGAQCGTQCLARLNEAWRMRITLGRNASRLRLVYIGPALPQGFVAAHAPLLVGSDTHAAFTTERAQGSDSLALALVDPKGWLMLRYPDGYSAQGLRRDIQKVIY